MLKETMDMLARYAYKIRYVPHEIIEDYNATYNVNYENQHITTNAAKVIGVPLNEIWISEMWKPYEKYILFHELREIHHRAKGLSRNNAHEKAMQDGFTLWKNDPMFQKFIKEIKSMNSRKEKGITRFKILRTLSLSWYVYSMGVYCP
ncbi:MAG: hypothetical protein QHH12_04305 [Candidatus Bathyarchaeota archaeon]|nr:hypothetical protein [Candidatus Bathyarchaeota archaeon A05DMB-3]MDH7606974.1 hypothetical protein [Candidatus Bathyarchaeota archaeon]